MNYHVELRAGHLRDLVPKDSMLIIAAESVEEAAERAEEVALSHQVGNNKASYICCTPFTDIAHVA